MCKDEPVVVEENIENKIPDLDSFVELTNQGIDLFNSDSAFYTDICYHYKSPIDGKDIPLKERFKLFFPNASLCEKGCSIKGINTTTNASICECSLNKLINNEFLEDNILLGGAMGELKTLIEDTNIEVLKCYGDITNGELIAKNYGSFIILGLIISQIILAVIYFIAYISSMSRYLFNLIENILSHLSKKENNTQNSFKKQSSKNDDVLIEEKNAPPKQKSEHSMKNKINETEINRENKKPKLHTRSSMRRKEKNKTKSEIGEGDDKHKNNKVKIFDAKSQINDEKEKDKNRQKSKNKMHDTKSEFLNQHEKIENYDENQYVNKQSDGNLISSENNSSSHLKKKSKNKKNKNSKIRFKEEKPNSNSSITNINIEEYMITEPDDMDYDNAIKRDNRSFCRIFMDKIISKILILNIIFNYEPLNPRPIKIILLILNIELYFFINGLFFNEDYLKEMLYDKESNFLDFLSRFSKRISYIAIIGIITSYVIDFFFFEEKTIKRIYKREKDDIQNMKSELYQLIKNIKIRYCIFIIICFIFGVFIWYYIFCFNNIYPSMVKELIITSIIIYLIMQIIYLILVLFETILRLIALKCKSERLFKISQFLS